MARKRIKNQLLLLRLDYIKERGKDKRTNDNALGQKPGLYRMADRAARIKLEKMLRLIHHRPDP